MYAFIEGEVCSKNGGMLVLLAGGVGYQILCSANTLQNAPAVGSQMRCYTFLAVREDAMELYGFGSEEEKDMFLRLTSVSGVGAKMALAILGAMSLRDLNLAILMEDTAALCRAPGVGKKTAQRITLELKDKVHQADIDAAGSAGGTAFVPAAASALSEAMEALTALGYSAVEANNALARVRDQSDRPEELIRLALRSMANF